MTLGESEYALNYNEPETEELLKEYLSQKETLNISGTTLSLKENGLYRMTIYNRNVYLDIGTLIVPQKIAEQNKPFMSIMNAMIAGDKAIVNEAVHRDELRMNVGGFLFNSQEDLFIEFLSNQLMLSYLGIYLGITFLITAGAVLALQQLTQTADNEKRYKLLYQLGVDADAMRKTLKMQLGIYFGLPFLVAAIHSGITMYGVYQDVPYLTSRDIAQNVLFAAGLAVVVYSIYLVTTYAGCKRILKL